MRDFLKAEGARLCHNSELQAQSDVMRHLLFYGLGDVCCTEPSRPVFLFKCSVLSCHDGSLFSLRSCEAVKAKTS